MGLISWIRGKAIVELMERVAMLEAECAALKTNMNSLRGFVNNVSTQTKKRAQGKNRNDKDSSDSDGDDEEGSEDFSILTDKEREDARAFIAGMHPAERANYKNWEKL